MQFFWCRGDVYQELVEGEGEEPPEVLVYGKI